MKTKTVLSFAYILDGRDAVRFMLNYRNVKERHAKWRK